MACAVGLSCDDSARASVELASSRDVNGFSMKAGGTKWFCCLRSLAGKGVVGFALTGLLFSKGCLSDVFVGAALSIVVAIAAAWGFRSPVMTPMHCRPADVGM